MLLFVVWKKLLCGRWFSIVVFVWIIVVFVRVEMLSLSNVGEKMLDVIVVFVVVEVVVIDIMVLDMGVNSQDGNFEVVRL